MYIHVIIVAQKKTLMPAGIPWCREWHHSANSIPLKIYKIKVEMRSESREREKEERVKAITILGISGSLYSVCACVHVRTCMHACPVKCDNMHNYIRVIEKILCFYHTVHLNIIVLILLY